MLDEPSGGFCEREHIADWELEAWATDLSGLLEQAARGMYTLSGTRLAEYPRIDRSVEITASDAESLLVKFLQELLYFGEKDGVGFDRFSIMVSELHLQATLEGAAISSQDKEIKAVTYHKLQIRQTSNGLIVNIVFDV